GMKVDSLKAGTIVSGSQQVNVAMHLLLGGPVEDIDLSLFICQRAHAAAAAGAGRLGKGRLLGGEGLALVVRAGDPHTPFVLTLDAGVRSMPDDTDMAGLVRRDRTAAIETDGGLNHIALRLEDVPGIRQACVEHARRL